MTEWIISSSVLILVVISLRRVFRGRISLCLQYALWALVLVRLLVPVSFGSTALSVNNLSEAVRERPIVQVDVSRLEGSALEALDLEAYALMHGPSVSDILGNVAKYIWLSGVIVAALCLFISNRRFTAMLKKTRREYAGVQTAPLPVYVSGAVEIPCLFGLFNPSIYITPEVMDNETVLRHALEHETTHFRHRDHVWALMRCLCLIIHWYNPLVWLAGTLSRRDAELACDEGTIRRIGDEERLSYGSTLIALTCEKNRAAALFCTATTMTGSEKIIKERISLIAKRPRTLWAAAVAVVLIAALAVGCTFTGTKDKTIDLSPAAVKIAPATDELLSQYSNYDEIDASWDEYGIKLLLTTDRTLRDLSLFSLIWDGTAGELVTPARGGELYRAAKLAELTPDKPLVVWVSFPGVFPTVGFSFTDADETVKSFYITMSGDDGSVRLHER